MSEPTYPLILTKENFWNEIQGKYPKSMKMFCDWVDEYKKRVEWDDLFGKWAPPSIHARPKFHEIPVAMQIGIFFEFTTEMFENNSVNDFLLYTDIPPTVMQSMIINIQLWFSRAEIELVNNSSK